jgi:CBS domain-containing protein
MNTVRQLLQNKGHEISSIEPNKSVYDAMQLMAAENIGALLLLEDRKLIAISSIGDLVKDTISDREFVIDQLERYIYETR